MTLMVLSQPLATLAFETRSHTKSKKTNFIALAGQPAPAVLPSLSPQCWDCKSATPHLAFCIITFLFIHYVGGLYAPGQVRRSEDKLEELGLPFFYVCPGD